jgi:type II secretory pathway component PulC
MVYDPRMKRPPWIAIVLGLCAWGGVIALAVNDIWWPLWVVGATTGLALLGGLVALMWARRMVKGASAVVKQAEPPARTEPIAEPPKPTGRSGPRTNARTAGRRNKGAATAFALGLCAVHAHGCGRRDEGPTEKTTGADAKTADAKGDAKTDTKAAEAKPAAAPLTGEDPALAAVLERAIRPPPTGEATYELDAFVAALVFERVLAGQGPTFTRLEKPVQGGPQAGFVVGEVAEGTLAHRLGLRTGDVVEAINGVVLTHADRVGFALDGAAKRVELTIHRDEVSIVQQYTMIEGLAWTELLASFTGDADPRLAAAGGGEAPPAADEGTPVEPPADDGRGDGAVPVEPTPEPAGGDDGGSKPSSGGGKLPTPGGGGGGGSGGGTSPKPKPTPPPKTTPTPPPSGSSPVACESSVKCTVTKAYFDSLVANPAKLESQANIVPAIANDVHSGYKLKSIKPGSAISKLGFRSEDKITHINGKDLTDDFQAAQLYMGISDTKVFKIRYERGGTKLVKTVLVD